MLVLLRLEAMWPERIVVDTKGNANMFLCIFSSIFSKDK